MAETRKPGIGLTALAMLPWFIYGVLALIQRWNAATISGLICSLAYVAILSRRSTVRLMDWTSVAYFAFSVAAVTILRMISYPLYHVVIVWSFFAVPAWASILARRPFTAAYARETTPPEVWRAPEFERFNVALTLMFALTFTLDAALSGLAIVTNRPLSLGFVLPMALFIAAMVISRKYPERFARSLAAERMLRLAHMMPANQSGASRKAAEPVRDLV